METCALSANNALRIGWTRNRKVVLLPARKTSAMTYIRISNLNLTPQDNSPLRFLKKLTVDVMAFGAVFCIASVAFLPTSYAERS